MSQTNVQVIEALYRAFREKDYQAFERICHPQIEWIQNEGFPRGATRRGAQAVIDGVFKAFDTDWDSWRFVIEEYLDAGPSIIVLGVYEGVHRKTGKVCRAPAAHVYDILEGRVARFRQFTDTKMIWDAIS